MHAYLTLHHGMDLESCRKDITVVAYSNNVGGHFFVCLFVCLFEFAELLNEFINELLNEFKEELI